MEYFWTEIVGVLAEAGRIVVDFAEQGALLDEREGVVEAAQIDVARLRDVDVGGRDGPVHHVPRMQVVECVQNGLSNELQRVLVEAEALLLVRSVYYVTIVIIIVTIVIIIIIIGIVLITVYICVLMLLVRVIQVVVVDRVENVLARAVVHERINAPYLRLIEERGQ